MNGKCMEYNGFYGSTEISLEDNVIHGKILFINDLVTYEADNLSELKKEFELAVDDYLETCTALDMEPCKPFKGTFNVRVGNDLHKKLANCAAMSGVTLNEFVKSSIEEKIANNKKETNPIEHIHTHTHNHVHPFDTKEVSMPFNYTEQKERAKLRVCK